MCCVSLPFRSYTKWKLKRCWSWECTRMRPVANDSVCFTGDSTYFCATTKCDGGRWRRGNRLRTQVEAHKLLRAFDNLHLIVSSFSLVLSFREHCCAFQAFAFCLFSTAKLPRFIFFFFRFLFYSRVHCARFSFDNCFYFVDYFYFVRSSFVQPTDPIKVSLSFTYCWPLAIGCKFQHGNMEREQQRD